LRGVGLASAKNGVNQWRDTQPAKEIETWPGKYQDLKHSGTECEKPRAGMDALHSEKFSKVNAWNSRKPPIAVELMVFNLSTAEPVPSDHFIF
jgi:hypothetical protein